MNNIYSISLDSIFNNEQSVTSIDLKEILIVIGVSLALGLLLSFVYMFTHKKKYLSPGLPLTIVLLPLIVSVIIMLVSNSMAIALSLAGVFTLVRFRSEPGEPSDLCYIFTSVAIGLCCGMGMVLYALLITLVICAFLMIAYLLKFGYSRKKQYSLKIVIPEDLNFDSLFDDIFSNYQLTYHLEKFRTIDYGTNYELNYYIESKNDFDQKQLLDDIRVRNGNLNITLTVLYK